MERCCRPRRCHHYSACAKNSVGENISNQTKESSLFNTKNPPKNKNNQNKTINSIKEHKILCIVKYKIFRIICCFFSRVTLIFIPSVYYLKKKKEMKLNFKNRLKKRKGKKKGILMTFLLLTIMHIWASHLVQSCLSI